MYNIHVITYMYNIPYFPDNYIKIKVIKRYSKRMNGCLPETIVETNQSTNKMSFQICENEKH